MNIAVWLNILVY